MFSKPRSYWKFVLYLILTLVCFLLQSVPAFGVRFMGCAPSLLLLITVGVAFFETPAFAAWFGLTAGLLSQLTTETVVGLDALVFMFSAYFIAAALDIFLRRRFLVYLFVALGLCAVHLMIDYFYHVLLWDGVRFSVALVSHILPVFFFSGIFAFPIYGILHRYDRKFAVKEDLQ